MGNLLSAPVTEKETHKGVTKDEKLKYGLSSMQGWRVHMEDAHIAEGDLYALEVSPDRTGSGTGTTSTKLSLPGHALFAVYDGHGGTFAALYSGNNFLRVLSKQTKFVRYAKMCREDYAASDHLSAVDDDGNSGTTSCVVMITPESIVCANAGDSRAVFARRPPHLELHSSGTGTGTSVIGKAVPLSFDHKPDDEEEERRVRNAGGYVAGGRVEGDLAVSRGLGDFRFKVVPVGYDGNDQTSTTRNNNNSRRSSMLISPGDQKVSPIPDVIVHARNAERDEYVVVACDGIWDVVSNQQCIAELDQIMYDEGERDLGLVAEEILDTCLSYGSKDNMTAIVVQLPGCEKSYTDAAARAKNSTGGAEPRRPQREGVAGRRRKRVERPIQRDGGDDDEDGAESPSASEPL
eukprot:jgi/Psemu1/257913/estExt_Genewise1Plus.C_2510041